MKRTTYILIGAVCAAVIISFFIPALMLRSTKDRADVKEILYPKGDLTILEINNSEFTGLSIGDYGYDNFEFDNYLVDLTFDIEQNDTIDHPRLLMDSSWEPLIESFVKNGTLFIKFKDIDKKDRKITYSVPSDNLHVATIVIPKGKIEKIDQDRNYISCLKNLEAPALRIKKTDNIDFINCRIDTISINRIDEE